MALSPPSNLFFFFNDTATTEIYTLSLHDALPIFCATGRGMIHGQFGHVTHEFIGEDRQDVLVGQDRKSTRLNSSHSQISYAVFCLKKKKLQRAVNIGFSGGEEMRNACILLTLVA